MHQHDCGNEGCEGSSLRQHVDWSKAFALNSRAGRKVRDVVDRSWASRAERAGVAPLETPEEEDDDELIVHLPFSTDVAISGILLSTDSDGTAPTQLRAFANRPEFDFSSANSAAPSQAWHTESDPGALREHLTRRSRFARTSSLSLHFPSSYSGTSTRIWWIGIRGVGGQTNRNQIADAVYEIQPQSNAETNPTTSDVARHIS